MVIVSWNTRELLNRCLCSVRAALAAEPGLSAEVFVVDNASADGSAAMVRDTFPDVRLIENSENVGFARAVNVALRQATGRYWLLLNSDTQMPPGTMTTLCAVLESRTDAAVCGPFLQNADGSPQFSWARFPGPRSEWTGHLDRLQSPYPLGDFAPAAKRTEMQPFTVDWIGAACLLVRAESARRVGLLDEGFFFYGEDADLCYRLRQQFGDQGGKTLLVPVATVTHLGGQSSRRIVAAARRHLFWSSLRLYRKLYGISPTALTAMALAAARNTLSPLRRGRKEKNGHHFP